VLLVIAAPWVMSVFLDSSWDSAALAGQRESLVTIARYCLPQVFFYGMFVLVGQILNARGTFGPMMWAPIANNVISILVLGLYLVTFGPAAKICSELYDGPAAPVDSVLSAYTPGREALLGLGSTLGIAAQFVILLPYLRKAGFRFSPRFDFRDTGLGHTLRLGAWTVAFVIVNQIAYTVVVRLASSGTASAAAECAAPATQGTGYTIYSNSFLLAMVPHSIITVSLATAILPTLSARAADGDLVGLGRTLSRTLRNALAVMIPFALCLAVIAPFLAKVVWGLGAGSDSYQLYVPTLTLFAVAIVCFTVHYLMLRGFYALELNRTVFFVQCAIATTNIVVAIVLVRATSAQHTAPRWCART
jgi:putative peptidoglycan lipid II flippase